MTMDNGSRPVMSDVTSADVRSFLSSWPLMALTRSAREVSGDDEIGAGGAAAEVGGCC